MRLSLQSIIFLLGFILVGSWIAHAQTATIQEIQVLQQQINSDMAEESADNASMANDNTSMTLDNNDIQVKQADYNAKQTDYNNQGLYIQTAEGFLASLNSQTNTQTNCVATNGTCGQNTDCCSGVCNNEVCQ